jgi:hypothetical protein
MIYPQILTKYMKVNGKANRIGLVMKNQSGQ